MKKKTENFWLQKMRGFDSWSWWCFWWKWLRTSPLFTYVTSSENVRKWEIWKLTSDVLIRRVISSQKWQKHKRRQKIQDFPAHSERHLYMGTIIKISIKIFLACHFLIVSWRIRSPNPTFFLKPCFFFIRQ